MSSLISELRARTTKAKNLGNSKDEILRKREEASTERKAKARARAIIADSPRVAKMAADEGKNCVEVMGVEDLSAFRRDTFLGMTQILVESELKKQKFKLSVTQTWDDTYTLFAEWTMEDNIDRSQQGR